MRILSVTSILIVLFLNMISLSSAQTTIVSYCPVPESKDDTRFNYAIELLDLALNKTTSFGRSYELVPAIDMNVGRAIDYLKRGDEKTVNVLWTTTSKEREALMLPIRIPIRKGLLGYRIFLIRKQDKEKFAAIKSIEELKKLKVGQGHIWNDVKIFQANGFGLVKGSSYEGLFEMLCKGRFDYFSRGINEAPTEYETRKGKLPNLWVEETILLYYPWPKYFFTSKKNPTLAIQIEQGLKMMINDGSFDKHFFKYHHDDIKKVNLQKRFFFVLHNPLLPSTTPLDRKELWFDPFETE